MKKKKELQIIIPEEDDNKPEMEYDEAMGILVKSGTDDDFFKPLEGNSTNKKQELIKQLYTNKLQFVEGNIEAWLVALKSKTKLWKITSVEILAEIFGFFQAIIALKNKFRKRHYNIMFPLLVEKVTEGKWKEQIIKIFDAVAEELKVPIVLDKFSEFLAEPKKVLPKAALLISEQIAKFIDAVQGKSIPLIKLFQVANNLLEQSTQYKKGGIMIYSVLYKYMGEGIDKYTNDLSAQNKKTLLNEMAKLAQQKVPQKEQPDTEKPQENVKMDSKEINNTFAKNLQKVNDSRWEIKKQAIDSIVKTLENFKPQITSAMLKEQVEPLIQKLQEQNPNVLKASINWFFIYVELAGKDMKTHLKRFLNIFMKLLADKQYRNDAIKALDSSGKSLGNEIIINMLLPFFTSDNLIIRTDVID